MEDESHVKRESSPVQTQRESAHGGIQVDFPEFSLSGSWGFFECNYDGHNDIRDTNNDNNNNNDNSDDKNNSIDNDNNDDHYNNNNSNNDDDNNNIILFLIFLLPSFSGRELWPFVRGRS